MNKGETIRKMIQEGHDDQAILLQVSTTINSVRWHRSKMKLSPVAPKTATSTVALSVGAKTVGGVAEKHGFVEIIMTGLAKLNVGNAEEIYKNLAKWNFKTNGRAHGRYGQCNYRTRTIEVHSAIVNLAEDFKGTFLHEVAHALDSMIHGRSSHHGANWQTVMVALGRDPTRTGDHSEEAHQALTVEHAKKRAGRKVLEVWVCDKCDHEENVFKKRKYHASRYAHTKCGGTFGVKGEEINPKMGLVLVGR